MGQVEDAWEQAAAAAPTGYPPLSEVQMLPEWGGGLAMPPALRSPSS